MLATAANRLAAQLVGINTRRIVAVSFALSAALGAVAGILITPITLTSYDVGTLLALKGFAAAMLGGMGSAVGAVVGGLLLGLLEAFAAGYVSSHYKDAVAFVVILLVLFAMPRGPVRPAHGRAGLSVRALLDHRLARRAGAGRPGRRVLPLVFPSAYYYRVAALVFVFALACVGLEPADGLRRPGQPRPRRLLRHRRLRGRDRSGPSRPAVVARCPRRRRAVRAASPSSSAGRSCASRATISRWRRSASGFSLAIVFTNEARLTGGPDGMSVPRARAARLARARRDHLVLDLGGAVPDRRLARAQPDRQPDRARAAGAPRQRGRGARARHRRRAQEARGLRRLGGLRLGRRLLPRAAQRLHHAGRRRASCTRSSSSPWWCSAAWPRSSGSLVGAARADGAAAGADRRSRTTSTWCSASS